MRMMEDAVHQQQQSSQNVVPAAYHHHHHRLMNEHRSNIIPPAVVMTVGTVAVAEENVVPEKGGAGTDDDDEEDTDLVTDGEIEHRLGMCRSTSGEISAGGGGGGTTRGRMEQEKRLRREIANSNERRRMQSINAGFQSLKALLPRRDGEKMSKASILQHTADFIRRLQLEKDMLMEESSEVKQKLNRGGSGGGTFEIRLRNNNNATTTMTTPPSSCIPKAETLPIPAFECHQGDGNKPVITDTSIAASPVKKRKKLDNDSADEGLGMMSDAEAFVALRMSPQPQLQQPQPPYSYSPTATMTTIRSLTSTTTQTEPRLITADVSCCTTPVISSQYQLQQCAEPQPPKSVEAPQLHEKLMEIEQLQRQLIELRLALDRERRVRLMLEEQIRVVELNHLQALTRLQPVPLLDFPSNMAAANASRFVSSSPLTAVSSSRDPNSTYSRPQQPPNVVFSSDRVIVEPIAPPAAVSSSENRSEAGSSSLLNSLSTASNAVCSQMIPIVDAAAISTSRPLSTETPPSSSSSTANDVCGASPPVSFSGSPPASQPAAITAATKLQTANTPPAIANTAVSNNGAVLFQQTPSSKQSLAAIVEAIRHLEGDQLFIDVDLHRPMMAQQQSIVVNAFMSAASASSSTENRQPPGQQNAPGFGPAAADVHSANVLVRSSVARPDYTDSGISSPVSERQGGGGVAAAALVSTTATTGSTTLAPPRYPAMTATMAASNNDGDQTAMALHNKTTTATCFPYIVDRNNQIIIDTKSAVASTATAATFYQQQNAAATWAAANVATMQQQ